MDCWASRRKRGGRKQTKSNKKERWLVANAIAKSHKWSLSIEFVWKKRWVMSTWFARTGTCYNSFLAWVKEELRIFRSTEQNIISGILIPIVLAGEEDSDMGSPALHPWFIVKCTWILIEKSAPRKFYFIWDISEHTAPLPITYSFTLSTKLLISTWYNNFIENWEILLILGVVFCDMSKFATNFIYVPQHNY